MDGINLCAAPLDIDPRQRYFTTVQPFSYRDTLTVLGYVQEVADHLDELRESVDNLAKDENADVEAMDKTLADTATQLNNDMTALRAELLALIHEMEQQGVATSPVYGTTQPLGDVLGGMYDNSRNHGLFWGDYDNMQLTAQEYDGLTLGAREYDLKATAVDNCMPGDFPGRSQFPYGKSMPENPVADMAFITQSEADARYVERNPTADNFDRKE